MHYYYLIIFFILSVFSILELFPCSQKRHAGMKLIAFFLIFITSACKYETGVDWVSYTLIFNSIKPVWSLFENGFLSLFGGANLEFGYVLICSFAKSVGGSIQLVFFIIAFINIILLYKSISFFSSYAIFCLLTYYSFVFFVLDMSGVRQSMAVNIILYGYRFIQLRMLKKYLITVILAYLFHLSAILLFPLYFLYSKKKFSLYIFNVLFIIAVLILLFQIKWITGTFEVISSYFGINSLTRKMITYTLSESFKDSYTFGVKALFYSSIYISYVYIFKQFKTIRFPFFLFFVFLFFYFLFFEISEISFRISVYFVVFLGVIISSYLKELKNQYDKLLIMSVAIIFNFLVVKVYILESPLTVSYSPYQNYMIHKIFDIPSTGEKRLDEFYNTHNK